MSVRKMQHYKQEKLKNKVKRVFKNLFSCTQWIPLSDKMLQQNILLIKAVPGSALKRR
jgi:hypothetical protein